MPTSPPGERVPRHWAQGCQASGILFQLGDKLQKLWRNIGPPMNLSNGSDGAQHLPLPANFSRLCAEQLRDCADASVESQIGSRLEIA